MSIIVPRSKRGILKQRPRRGVTLIMVSGVLVILAALAAGFYTSTLAQSRSASRYTDSQRAAMLAQAGIADAICRLREQTYFKTEDPTDPWYGINYCDNRSARTSFATLDKSVALSKERIPGDWSAARKAYTRALGNSVNSRSSDSDRYALKISDAAGKININAGDNLAVILDNLCRVIGAPLVAADLDYLQPRRWALEGANPALYGKNKDDNSLTRDLYYKPDLVAGSIDAPPLAHPDNKSIALFGDGYAIARYRSRYGRFKSIQDVKAALTVAPQSDHPELEALEREVKFSAIKDYITVDSWVDTTTVCCGKFEWADAGSTFAIDRDKSWIADDPKNDPDNHRGSLRGSYVSIITGHGAGQLRRIKTNGIDWIELDGGPWQIAPGPISSYMIIAREDALIGSDGLPQTDSAGRFIDDPAVDYQHYPLCIHRAPVNINTASDKVLMALLLGLNVQHGHPMSLGTDVDSSKLIKDPLPKLYRYSATGLSYSGDSPDWQAADDALMSESYLLTPRGLKRIPADSGKLVLDRPVPWETADRARHFGYLTNFDSLSAPNFVNANGRANEAHELAYRILVARQPDADEPFFDPKTGHASADNTEKNFTRGPFRSWDDLYFRVVRPWDEQRVADSNGPNGPKKTSIARMIMSHFNPNTDILKFNPNIEWIDRWGRNFTEMESILIFKDSGPRLTTKYSAQFRPDGIKNIGAKDGAYFLRGRRYRSEEMIDQTDLNRSTTQFSFDSSGIFEIESTGMIVKDDEVLSERKVTALVKVYDVWRETTQRQFVNGTFSDAAQKNRNGSSSGFTDAGKVTRDATNVSDFKALDTLPEPLVPLHFKLDAVAVNRSLFKSGAPAHIAERLTKLTNWLSPSSQRDEYTPDAVANKILPAGYDGQIVLAANTVAYDPTGDGDTFLASFNGDLDTVTCAGNGRELAKTPVTTQRVVDTIGLLGALSDGRNNRAEIDVDPDPICAIFRVDPASYNLLTTPVDKDPVLGTDSATPYWENMACRMGDLRADGVFLGACGISAKDATLKYEIAGNFPTQKTQQLTVQMWIKTDWHVNDGYEHEFFNASDPVTSRCFNFAKGHQFAGNYPGDGKGGSNLVENRNCLVYSIEDDGDEDYFSALHDGERKIPPEFVAVPGAEKKTRVETSSFKVQPFRWSNVGTTGKFTTSIPTELIPKYNAQAAIGFSTGFAHDNGSDDPYFKELVSDAGYGRPFIDTQRDPEGPSWTSKYHWAWRWLQGKKYAGLRKCDSNGQDLAWGALTAKKDTSRVFSLNNFERDFTANSIGRMIPSTGTEAVIDELKISGKVWSSKRIGDEQTLSRYYLPEDPTSRPSCPTYTSQTLLQSIRGLDKTPTPEFVTPARVSWTVFTPRFMHENKNPRASSRQEFIGGGDVPALTNCNFRGPFDYVQYNREIGYDALQGWKSLAANPRKPELDLECDRKPPKYDPASRTFKQSHATRGVEVELLDDTTVIGDIYTNPDLPNAVGTPQNPPHVRADRLRYRVRFRYPVDNARVDRSSNDTVNPSTQYLLDTPVFDDVSITYFTQPRIISYKEFSE